MRAPNTLAVHAAVKAVFDADSGLGSAGVTPLYAVQAPEDRGLPYAVMVPVSETLTERTTADEVWLHVIQFSVYDDGMAKLGPHLARIRDAFRERLPSLSASDGTIEQMRVNSEQFLMDDRDVWHGMLEYHLMRTIPRLALDG